MAISSVSPIISLRLPKEARERLDRAAAKMRRSRSFLMQRALERHLDEIEREEAQPPARRRLSTILELGGAGVPASGPRSAEEIDAHLRWLRDNT
jgi:predicted DNA-binding protein